MPNLRDIRRRISSVKNTQKITRAMQLVAASKMRRAQESAIAGRPYAQLMAEILQALQAHPEELTHPFFEPRTVKHRGVLLVTTEKGLCGPLNGNLFRLVAEMHRETTRFVVIGRKGQQFLARTARNVIASFNVHDRAAYSEVRPVVETLLEAYRTEEIDTVEVLFPQFINNLRQEPLLETILPLTELADLVQAYERIHDYTVEAPNEDDHREFLFEPDATRLLDGLVERYVKHELYQVILEAKASEHSARMVAMKTATDNAKELRSQLTLQFNKARQAAITQEILEITAASN